jgi:hypothetical protein
MSKFRTGVAIAALMIAAMIATWPMTTIAGPICMATFTRNGEWGASTNLNSTGAFYHQGETVALTGGSDNPKIFCQHGGYCAPIAAIKFNKPCKLVGADIGPYGLYYSWDPK